MHGSSRFVQFEGGCQILRFLDKSLFLNRRSHVTLKLLQLQLDSEFE